MTEPRDDKPTPAERIDALERVLREIVSYVDQHPEDDRLHVVGVLARVALEASIN